MRLRALWRDLKQQPDDLQAFIATLRRADPGCQPASYEAQCECADFRARHGFVTLEEAAALLKLTKTAVRQLCGQHRGHESVRLASQLYRFGPLRYRLVRRADVEQLRDALRRDWARRGGPSDRLLKTYGKLARERWGGRHNGPKGAAAGIEAGRALGGRKPSSTPEQQQRMLELDRRGGLSLRAIAEEVFGDPKYKDRVARFLNR